MSGDAKYERLRMRFERSLTEVCDREMQQFPSLLEESMRYSLFAGGKRLRPVLFLGTLDALGKDPTDEPLLAVAIECIHTYSLIHDDLPAMDNDDFRRGKPSNHKVFGEANAVLAGDGLLSFAFSLLLKASVDEAHRCAAELLTEAAGCAGMIAGQSVELTFGAQTGGEEAALEHIARCKTGAMIAAPCAMAAALTGDDVAGWKLFGETLGMLFQTTDDLLDYESGEDDGKLTAVSVYGLAGAQNKAEAYALRCTELLGRLRGETAFHRDLIESVLRRTD